MTPAKKMAKRNEYDGDPILREIDELLERLNAHSLTQRFLAKIDQETPPYEAIDTCRHAIFRLTGAVKVLRNEIKLLRTAIDDKDEKLDQKLSDTAIHLAVQRKDGQLKLDGFKNWRKVVITGIVTSTIGLSVAGVWWIVKMVWIGIHAQH